MMEGYMILHLLFTLTMSLLVRSPMPSWEYSITCAVTTLVALLTSGGVNTTPEVSATMR